MSATLATRRTLLIGGAALASGWRSVGTSVENPDAALLAMCAEAQAHDAESIRLYDLVGDLSFNDPIRQAVMAQSDAAMEKWDALIKTIVVTPAQTLDGLRAKAGLAKGAILLDADGAPEHGDRLAWLLACDVLAGSVIVPG